MGLFNLFNKKKDEDDNEPRPEDQMLQLNERKQPSLKSDTKPPGGTHPPSETSPPQAQTSGVMLTPDPEVNNGGTTVYNFEEAPAPEPEEFRRENLSTKSLEKNIQSMPSVKKLVIPGNDEALEKKVEATDNVIAERVKLKQVDLAGEDKSPEPSITPQGQNFIPGEFIDIPISFFTERIDPSFMSANAKTLFDNSSSIRFTKDEILSIMAQGAFAVVGSALLARFPADMISEKGKTTSEVLEFPLDQVMAKVPPDWFALQGQDNSLTESLSSMSNPFQDLESPEEAVEKPEEKAEEKVEQKPQNNLFADDDDEEEIEVEIDPLATVPQTKIPEVPEEPSNDTISSLETIVQLSPPEVDVPEPVVSKVDLTPKTEAPQAAAPVEAPETDDNTLVVNASQIATALKADIFFNFPQSAILKIPRDRVLKSLTEGNFNMTAKEIDTFAGTSSVDGSRENEVVEIDLALVMPLIPPEWFALEPQDTSQTDLLSNMNDVFDDSTFEEAAREINFPPSDDLEKTVVDADRDDEIPVSVEEEDKEEESEEGDSLITGGIFSKMNSLFEDEDEDEEEEVEIAIEEEGEAREPASLVEEEEEVQAPLIEEDEEEVKIAIEEPIAAAPVEITPPVVEKVEEPQAPAIEEPAASVTEEEKIEAPVIEEAETAAVEDLDSLQTISIHRDAAKVFDDNRIAEEQNKILAEVEKETEPVEAQTPAPAPTPTPAVETPAEDEKELDDEVKTVPGAGKVTNRPIADEVPDISEKTVHRPSTAPNGIDINRSNLVDLCRLHSAGEKLAQTLIEYREQNGDFKSINDLINVPGVGTSVYRSLTGLRPSSDLVAAERRINKVVGLSTDKDYPLGKVIIEAQEKFGFKSLILSDKDGFEICSSGDKSLLESNSELLAATTPQLFKKTKHFLKQSHLPHPEIFTFYLEDTPVTFGIADEVFMVMVHSSSWPEPKHMKQCRTLINELAWFCSYRAIV